MAETSTAPAAQAGQPREALASLFDCTPRQVELLAQRGIVVRVARGRYDLAKSTRNYIKHLREQAAARVGQDPDKDAVGANVKYKDASTRLLEMRLQKEAGQLIDVDEARSLWGGIIRQVRQAVLGVPGKIAFELPTISPHDRKVMDRICRDTLDDVAMGRGFSVTKGDGEAPTAADHVPAA
jgi:phage terminase Nu1 subunit (DNA packaging protein)